MISNPVAAGSNPAGSVLFQVLREKEIIFKLRWDSVGTEIIVRIARKIGKTNSHFVIAMLVIMSLLNSNSN